MEPSLSQRTGEHDGQPRHSDTLDSPSSVSSRELELELVGERKALGAFYTPPDVVEGLLPIAFDPLLLARELAGTPAVAALRVLDPTCGSGNFLVPVVERVLDSLRRCGLSRNAAAVDAVSCIVGVDLDQGALDECASKLHELTGLRPDEVSSQLRAADSMLMPLDRPQTLFPDPEESAWSDLMAEVGAPNGFDLVIGNLAVPEPTTNRNQLLPKLCGQAPWAVRRRCGYLYRLSCALHGSRRRAASEPRWSDVPGTTSLDADNKACLQGPSNRPGHDPHDRCVVRRRDGLSRSFSRRLGASPPPWTSTRRHLATCRQRLSDRQYDRS